MATATFQKSRVLDAAQSRINGLVEWKKSIKEKEASDFEKEVQELEFHCPWWRTRGMTREKAIRKVSDRRYHIYPFGHAPLLPLRKINAHLEALQKIVTLVGLCDGDVITLNEEEADIVFTFDTIPP